MAILQAKTKYGIVEGVPAGNQMISLFRGIPYAKAPVGDLRWKRPVEPEPWDGVLKCYKFSNICWQERLSSEGGGIAATEFYCLDHPRSEDCLHVNVWTPAKSADEKLPVAVYFHGGGWATGYGFLNCYDGQGMAKRGIVYVTVTHRLNAFGFMAHPWLTEEDPEHTSGNYGLLDLVQAMKWVNENIAAFGGDPETVTIFGQSGGGEKVQMLNQVEESKKLFKRAIMQSGGALANPNRDLYLADAEKKGVGFFEYCGFKSLEEARAMPAEELFEKVVAYKDTVSPSFIRDFRPNVDGSIVKIAPNEFYRKGYIEDHDFMVGNTSEEFYKPVAKLPTLEEVKAEGQKLFSERADEYVASTHIADDPAKADRVFGNKFGEDMAASTLAFADNQLTLGRKPAFCYYLTLVPPGADTAHHSAEHQYVFQTLHRSLRPYSGKDYDLSNQLCDYWSNFIKYGDPNGKSEGKSVGVDLPEWTPYTADSKKSMIIDYDLHMEEAPVDDYVKFLVDFFETC